MRQSLRRLRRAGLVAVALWTGAGGALGQATPYGGGQGFSPGQRPRPAPKKADPQPQLPPGTPEPHAAGGGESLLPPSQAPSLPRDPLKVKKSIEKRIGTDTDPDDAELGRDEELTKRRFYGLYYSEQSGGYRLRVGFPVWFERTKPSLTDPSKPDRASLFGGVYYNRRSATRADDILFPIFWNLREGKSRTTVVGPFVNRRTPEERDDWLAPLYFHGKRPRGGYTVIPPLLTYLQNDAEGGFNLVGPGFCKWEGGPTCDTRTSHNLDFGIAPFYFYGQNEERKYEVIPPLLHYYRYNDRDLSWVNVWGPYIRAHNQKQDKLHLFPFYWSVWGKNERHTTIFPLFHYGRKGNSSLLINPFFVRSKSEEGATSFATWGYARYRGRTELDMITPLWWHYRDADAGLDQKLLFPFLFLRESPRESTKVIFPFYARSTRYGISKETWITPFFQHKHHLRGWNTNIHPILYLGRNGHDSHTVVAPFFWDFAEQNKRTTVAFPFYWRFANRDSVSQLVGNVYYNETKVTGGTDWQIHLFPVFSYGETPDGHWWNVLYGLAGYTRRGEMTKMRSFWIPITLSEGAKTK